MIEPSYCTSCTLVMETNFFEYYCQTCFHHIYLLKLALSVTATLDLCRIDIFLFYYRFISNALFRLDCQLKTGSTITSI